jgi:hypothetical protein
MPESPASHSSSISLNVALGCSLRQASISSKTLSLSTRQTSACEDFSIANLLAKLYDFAPLAVDGFLLIVQSKQRRKRVTAACDLPIIQTSALLLA